jgi:hypothetical protein
VVGARVDQFLGDTATDDAKDVYCGIDLRERRRSAAGCWINMLPHACRSASAWRVAQLQHGTASPQSLDGFRMSLEGCNIVPFHGLVSILRNTNAFFIGKTQLELSFIMLPSRCKEEPSRRLNSVLRNTATLLKHGAQKELSLCKPLRRCKAMQARSLYVITCGTLTVITRGNSTVKNHCT